jgi:hypothetical protein
VWVRLPTGAQRSAHHEAFGSLGPGSWAVHPFAVGCANFATAPVSRDRKAPISWIVLMSGPASTTSNSTCRRSLRAQWAALGRPSQTLVVESEADPNTVPRRVVDTEDAVGHQAATHTGASQGRSVAE